MKKLFKNSLVALLLVGLTVSCKAKVDSKETTTENIQVITSEDNTSNTKSITSKAILKKTSDAPKKKETSTKETQVKTKETSEIKETTKASETKVSQVNASETEVRQASSKVKQTKSIEEIAKEVLNGKYGNGEQRKANLEKEGYNYNEVQSAVEKLLPTPTQPRQTQAQQNSNTQSQTQYNYAPLSLVINGEYFTMNTPYGPGEDPQTPVLQAILDRYNKEWVVENAINYKTHGDGQMPYLSMHNYPWGHYIRYANQILFTDSNGVTKTYVKAQTHGPIDFATGADNPERRALRNGEYGDGLVFQTCVDNYYNFVLVRFVLAE